MSETVSSNATALRVAEEETPGVLPAAPVWYEREPNEYDDFGASTTLLARRPLNSNRRLKKGRIVDAEATAGWQEDLTQNNMQKLLQGFFFADIRQKATTAPINGTAVVITNVDNAASQYQAAAGLDVFSVGDIIFASGFTNPSNNGAKVVTAVAAGAVTVDAALVDEVPTASAALAVAGFEAEAADIDVAVTAGVVSFESTLLDFTTLGLVAGQWGYVGGDDAGNSFANNAGYFRVHSISANSLVVDKTTWAAVAEAGTGKSIRFYFGDVIRDEDAALIVRRTYTLERELGEDVDGPQAEYGKFAVANELSFNSTTGDFLRMGISYMPSDTYYRTGAEGLVSAEAGTIVPTLGEEAFSMATDVARLSVREIDPSDSFPTALIGFMTDFALTINNNVTPNKAISRVGAFAQTEGFFEVTGEMTGYFKTVAAQRAIRNNADVTLDMILAKENAGIVFDVPLVALSGGMPEVAENEPITLPLEHTAGESSFGHTASVSYFGYLPDAAMPDNG